MEAANSTVSIAMSFEVVAMPPFHDILIIGRKSPHGSYGMSTCMDLLAPDCYELIEIDDEVVESILVRKALLARLPVATLIDALKQHVFPQMSLGEMMKVDMKVSKNIAISAPAPAQQ